MTKPLVMITGGSSGIGLGLSKYYAKNNWHVVMIARDEVKLATAIEQCNEVKVSSSQLIKGFSVDVSDWASVQKVLGNIITDAGVPDLLVLSAGIAGSVEFLNQSEDFFEATINTNVMGSVNVVRAVLPMMEKKRRGHICFIGSLAGLMPVYGYTAYSASKYSIQGFAGALRLEMKNKGINVSIVCPPEVDTPMFEHESKDLLAQTKLLKKAAGRLNVDDVVSATVKGLKRNKLLIVPGTMAKMTYLQSRLFPGIFSWFSGKLVKFASK